VTPLIEQQLARSEMIWQMFALVLTLQPPVFTKDFWSRARHSLDMHQLDS
jgi:hypothetical protein